MLKRMDEQREREIARGLREGETEAWHALYDGYARAVWQAVARLIGPQSADVGDVVQEVFLAAAKSARGYDASRGSLWGWLMGIARYQVAMHFRRQERHRRLRALGGEVSDVEGLLAWLEGREPTPPEVMASDELADLVRGVLLRLPTDYATLLTAKYLDGAAAEELAGQQQCSATAIRSKLARAREAFRRVFTRATGGCSPAEEARENSDR